MRFVRPPRRRGRVIAGLAATAVLLFGAQDCYRREYRAFANAYVPAADGEVEVSLNGAYSRDGRIKGNPYDLMVRFLTRDSTITRAELATLSLRGVDGGDTIVVRGEQAVRLRPVSPEFGWSSRTFPIARGQFYAAFLESGVRLDYHQDYDVSGRLRLIGAAGVREVPFRATLRRTPNTEWHSRFWDAFMSV